MSNVEVAMQHAMLKKYDNIVGGTPEKWMCLCMLQDGCIGVRSRPRTRDELETYIEKLDNNPRVGDGWSDHCTGVRLN
jgi:hypothetical protein